ncbi:4-hydroxybenzoyl-CoA thioesterase [Salmonella enterica subsp. enterica serovar Choleraesuis]|nr:4-hydroxybenzoyl-CoA thioesterase [Salmonella enterica subsp. enterica serovar Choleraesuis]
MKRSPYFKSQDCVDGQPAPQPVSVTIERVVRFEEVDMMTVLWHGHYASYFEDARVALGDYYGIGYHQMMETQVMAPVRQMYVDYRAPLEFSESCKVTATLHWNEAARMNISYLIENSKGELVATGYTVQMFIDKNREVMLEQPEFLRTFCDNWKNGSLPG